MNPTRDCDNPECSAELARMPVQFCPYCGERQLVAVINVEIEPVAPVRLVRPVHRDLAPVSSSMTFEAHTRSELSSPYCDARKFAALVRYGMQTHQLTQRRAEAMLGIQLEKLGVANESKLLCELDGMLRNFTDSDKKLDKKEWSDALQDACRARPGYARGLDADEAERFILKFCRQNNVKVKVGMFKWAVP